jgi:hypothetical protein
MGATGWGLLDMHRARRPPFLFRGGVNLPPPRPIGKECEGIIYSATGDSRAIFELGQSTTDGSKVNWVIYWLLWQTKNLLTLEHGTGFRCSRRLADDAVSQSGGKRPGDDRERAFWDPVRNL